MFNTCILSLMQELLAPIRLWRSTHTHVFTMFSVAESHQRGKHCLYLPSRQRPCVVCCSCICLQLPLAARCGCSCLRPRCRWWTVLTYIWNNYTDDELGSFRLYIYIYIWRFPEIEVPKIILLNGIFPYKPSILIHFGGTPFVETPIYTYPNHSKFIQLVEFKISWSVPYC